MALPGQEIVPPRKEWQQEAPNSQAPARDKPRQCQMILLRTHAVTTSVTTTTTNMTNSTKPAWSQ